MDITFHKYQGTGNDFVMVDNRSLHWSPTAKEVQIICDRRFGVGADGLILIQNHDQHDFHMIYFNSDGSQSLCGNGSRCAIRFAHELGIIGELTQFLTTDGVHQGKILGDLVSFQLFDISEISQFGSDYFIDNGSPHFMKIVAEVDDYDVFHNGSTLRHDPRFGADGTNVNFIEVDDHRIKVRTFERGVEGETLSCGTGVTAAALTMAHQGWKSPVKINTKGGDLEVSFQYNGTTFSEIYLTGPAEPVYSGNYRVR